MVPPIEYGLGYQSRNKVQPNIWISTIQYIWFNPNRNPTLKATIMYAVQNDTEIKFNIVLYTIKSFS